MCQRGVYKWVDRFRRGWTSVAIPDTERSTGKWIFITQTKIFYCDGIRQFGESGMKYIEWLDDYVEK
jgi:hypothetical protein